MSRTIRALLGELYDTAVAAAHPSSCLPAYLPEPPPSGRLIVLAVGKAAAAMAAVTEEHYRARGMLDRIEGFATVPYGYAASLHMRPQAIEIVEARHPTPDAASVAAADRALASVSGAGANDLVLVLLSGGASSLWAAPAAGLDLDAKTALTRGLLKSGADIHEMNTVRRHLSRIKGGRLRRAGAHAPMLTLAISDVPGDDPQTIGSGPSVPDPSTLADARAVLDRRRPSMSALGLPVPDAVEIALRDAANETPKPGDAAFSTAQYRIIATPKISLAAAARLALSRGYELLDLGDRVTGEARHVASEHAQLARRAKSERRRLAIISGGELEVTVRSKGGRGGRSQEYALALAVALDGLEGVAALAGDTDGIDGGEGQPTDPAGALVLADTLARARGRHLDAQKFLDNNDATSFFEPLGDLLVRGPTHTNVNDFRVILVDP
ncbi:MAG: glycerate kinase type-2 family protein [Bacteroidota bacterium]